MSMPSPVSPLNLHYPHFSIQRVHPPVVCIESGEFINIRPFFPCKESISLALFHLMVSYNSPGLRRGGADGGGPLMWGCKGPQGPASLSSARIRCKATDTISCARCKIGAQQTQHTAPPVLHGYNGKIKTRFGNVFPRDVLLMFVLLEPCFKII